MRNKNELKEKLKYYMSLPYTIAIIAEKRGYFAEIEELPGCMTEGDSIEETFQHIKEAQELWLEEALKIGREVPLPREIQEYSGKFLVRMPKYLHRKLAEKAKKEGVSLNQLVVILLTESLKQKEALEAIEEVMSQNIIWPSKRGVFSPRTKIIEVTAQEGIA